MTLYVESNFVLEIALGQEDSTAAERLLQAAEGGVFELALPAFSLSEPFATLTQHERNREQLRKQVDGHVRHLSRSRPHQDDVSALRSIPDALARIDQREDDRLAETIDRLLSVAIVIETDLWTFRQSRSYRTRFGFSAQDAIIYAAVAGHLCENSTPQPHVFANRNKRDFVDPGIASELQDLGCQLVYTFSGAISMLHMSDLGSDPKSPSK